MRWRFLGVCLTLAACGGGGGGGDAPAAAPAPPPEPVQFGTDQAFEAPAFSGALAVGSSAFHWTDTSREETFTTAADNRELMVRVFYPTDDGSGTLALPVIRTRDLGNQVNQQLVANRQLRRSNFEGAFWTVFEDAGVSAARPRFPVMIFSHGGGGALERNLFIAADLASRGIVVLAINHTFHTDFVEFPDGRVVSGQGFGLDDDGTIDPAEGQLLAQAVELWAADQLFAYEQLLLMDQDPATRFGGRLDLSRVATGGFSLGGAAGYEAAGEDPRIAAVIDLDGTIWDPRAIAVPFLFVQSNEHQLSIFSDVAAPAYAAVFDGRVTHGGFEDPSLYWRWDFPTLNPFGSLGGIDALRATTELMAQFLAKTFDGEPAPALDDDTQAPDGVRIVRF